MTLESQYAQGRFQAGWSKYVDTGFHLFGTDPIPGDVYWDPRKADWETYPGTKNVVQDEGWPTYNIKQITAPSDAYDRITAQYQALPQNRQGVASWDPRRGQWMSVSARSKPGDTDPRIKALDAIIHLVEEAHNQKYLGEVTYTRVSELINGER